MTIDELRSVAKELMPWKYRLADEQDSELTESMRLLRDSERSLHHQFTLMHESDTVVCVAAQLLDFHRSLRFLFVFRSGTLEKFVRVPSYRFQQVGTQDGTHGFEPIIDPEGMLNQVLQADGFSDESLEQYVTKTAEMAIASRRQHSEPMPGLIDALISASRPSDAERAKDIALYFHRLDEFDGLKVPIGMSIDAVQELFGEPIAVRMADANERRLYGFPSRPSGAGIADPLILVEFKDDKVQRVFSGEFIDIELYLGKQR